MKTLKNLAFALIMALGLASLAQASGGGMVWDKAPGKTTDQASLQSGAKLFVNYCLNCRAAAVADGKARTMATRGVCVFLAGASK